jgi:hypothetical protein
MYELPQSAENDKAQMTKNGAKYYSVTPYLPTSIEQDDWERGSAERRSAGCRSAKFSNSDLPLDVVR